MDFKKLSRSYDFRGIYGVEFTDEDFRTIGRAIALWTDSRKIVLWYDARLTSSKLAEEFSQGVTEMGKDVVFLGITASDMLQYATIAWEDVGLALMVTASHSPKEYNGFKLCLKNAEPVNLKTVGIEIAHLVESGATETLAEVPGKRENRDILPLWIEKVASFTSGDFSDLVVVADAGNGVAGTFMPALAEKLGFKLIPLFFEPDGNFPNHHPSPIESKNMVDLQRKVREVGANIGVAFDGDADRAVMCDENADIISSSRTLAAIAEMRLMANPGKKIIYNTTTSDIVADTVRSVGGTPIREKVGHVYIKEHMKNDSEVIFAGESSSHYFFPEIWNADSWVIAFVCLLEYLNQYELSASEFKTKFSKYQNIEETNFKVSDPKEVISTLSYIYNTGIQDRFDGLTVRFNDWWFNVRPAANDPVLRLNIETTERVSLEEKFEELKAHIIRFAQ